MTFLINKDINKRVFFIGLSSLLAFPVIAATALGPATYPSRTSGGTPAGISNGIGITAHDVVTGITIDDDSGAGWTLTVTSTNGTSTQPRLLHSVDGTTIDYDLEINNISGTLGTGLTLSPAANTTLTFAGASTTIDATGTASTSTVNYQFDLQMTISNASTVGKLSGTYDDSLSLLLASND